MGEAVGSVAGMVGGVVGDVAGAMTPKIKQVNQDKLNQQIDTLQGNAGNYQNSYGQLQNIANNQLDNTNGYIAQAGTSIGQAQNANNMVGGDALSILRNAATGGAPSAAQAQLQSGKDQAIATQQAMANSGNLSQMIGGQKTAMDNAANLTQQAANQAAQLRASEMGTARGQYGQQAAQFAGQAGANAGLANNLATTNANLYGTQLAGAQNFAGLENQAQMGAGNLASGQVGINQGVQTQNAQNQVAATGGLLNGAGAALGKSDENSKENIHSDRASRASAVSGFFRNENKKDEPAPKEAKPAAKGYDDDDPRKAKAKAISDSFLSSDEEGKENIQGGSMIHSFLDKLEPVTFDYKDPNGEMGQTPGKHMGILAQDVEKAPGGDSMVVETPTGKAIDLASAVGMLMSAAADAHDRIGAVEELFKTKKASKK